MTAQAPAAAPCSRQKRCADARAAVAERGGSGHPLRMLPLASRNAHLRDRHVTFNEATHTYTVADGDRVQVVDVSVTAFASAYFTPFDATQIVDTYYAQWKRDASHKYHAPILAVLAQGGTDDDAKRSIKQQWHCNGLEASRLGTLMHEQAELLMNDLEPFAAFLEMKLLVAWRSEFQPDMRWRPYRTEWALWWEDDQCDGDVLVAGTLDLLMRSEATGHYGLFDFKRTDPKPKKAGGPDNRLAPTPDSCRWRPRRAREPLLQVEDNAYGKYSMQLNILSKILRERYSITVGQHMYLVQIHPDMQAAHTIRVPELRSATNALFEVEARARRAV